MNNEPSAIQWDEFSTKRQKPWAQYWEIWVRLIQWLSMQRIISLNDFTLLQSKWKIFENSKYIVFELNN